MRQQRLRNLILLATSVLLSLAGFELVVRLVSWRTRDGNVVIRGRVLKPYRLPVASTREGLEQLRGRRRTFSIDDPATGWAYPPNRRSADGLYATNSFGMRSEPREYVLTPPCGVTRIAIIGDSFTQGAEVPFEDTWGYELERKLRAAGRPAEVLNFGVGGYGVDQIYLRWKKLAWRFSPDLVILGFYPEDVKRNLNMLQSLYNLHPPLPFSKPRFVLRDDTLELVNHPALAPESVPDTLQGIARWSLRRHEHYYDPEDFRPRWWQRSVALRLFVTVASSNWVNRRQVEREYYDPEGESGRLTLAIVRALSADVRSRGGRFAVLHFPREADVADGLGGETPVPSPLVDRLRSNHPLIDPAPRMATIARAEGTGALYRGHLNARGNGVVADAVAGWVLAQAEPARRRCEQAPT